MTVGDLQQYLRALAVAVDGTAKTTAKELNDAVEALGAFALYKVSDFGTFLRAAEEKYRTCGGLLPDVPAPKKKEPPAPRKSPAPKPEKKTLADLKIVLDQLRGELASTTPPDRGAVEAILAPFDALKAGELAEVVKSLGYAKKPGSKTDSLKIIATTIMAASTASARAGV